VGGGGWRSHREGRPEGGLDAVSASWTIEAEEDGPVLHLTPQLRTIRTEVSTHRGAPVLAGALTAEPGDGAR